MGYNARTLPSWPMHTGTVILPLDPLWSPAGSLFAGTGFLAAAWTTANTAVMYAFSPPYNTTVRRLGWWNGSSAGDNWDVGIYDSDQATLLVSTGSTAGSGNNIVQTVGVTATALTRDKTYYIAVNHSSTTANRVRNAATFDVSALAFFGPVKTMAVGATALPATFVPADPAGTTVWPIAVIELKTGIAA